MSTYVLHALNCDGRRITEVVCHKCSRLETFARSFSFGTLRCLIQLCYPFLSFLIS
jgi:hypothetical protein